ALDGDGVRDELPGFYRLFVGRDENELVRTIARLDHRSDDLAAHRIIPLSSADCQRTFRSITSRTLRLVPSSRLVRRRSPAESVPSTPRSPATASNRSRYAIRRPFSSSV